MTRSPSQDGGNPDLPADPALADARLAAGELVAGRFRITRFLGRGGMGEVYEAVDVSLGEAVALKTIRPELAADSTVLQRFERELRLARRVTHPNVCRVFDLHRHGPPPGAAGTPVVFLTMELVVGETLEERLRRLGSLPVAEALAVLRQVVGALEAAHRAGVVHRDLKSANVILAAGESDSRLTATEPFNEHGSLRAVVTDFGLARGLFAAAAVDESVTVHGLAVGTPRYMAPELFAGGRATPAADIYSLGVLMHEMLTGRTPFAGPATFDPSLRQLPGRGFLTQLVPGLDERWESAIGRCLARDPADRFRRAHDVLVAVGAAGREASIPWLLGRLWQRGRARAQSARPLGFVALGVAGGAVGAVLLGGLRSPGGRSVPADPRPPPRFQRLTYQRGTVEDARFGPDGQTVFYSARWNGARPEVFTVRPRVPEPLALGLRDATLLAVGDTELRVLLAPSPYDYVFTGTLARAPLSGGSARMLREGVVRADLAGAVEAWTDPTHLEFPAGTVVGPAAGEKGMRLSRDGTRLALIHESRLMVQDAGGSRRTLTDELYFATGIAWSPDGSEIWLSRVEQDQGTTIAAYGRDGGERVVFTAPGMLRLHDIAPDGSLLVSTFTRGREVRGGRRGTAERELTWLADSAAVDFSPDRRAVLITDNTAGSYFGVRDLEGSPVVRLGAHFPSGFSASGDRVLAKESWHPCVFAEVPVGPGEIRRVRVPRLLCTWGEYAPGGLLVQARDANEDVSQDRLYRVDADGALGAAVTPPGWAFPIYRNLSPDGRLVLARSITETAVRYRLFPLAGGESRPLDLLPGGAIPQGWAGNGEALFVLRRGAMPALVQRVDLASGAAETFLELRPADPAGVASIQDVTLSQDGALYAYSYFRELSDLHLVTGLR